MTLGAQEGVAREASGAEPASREGRFDLRTVLTLAGAHGGHDMYSAFLAPLLPALIGKLGLSLMAAGALATAQRTASLIQPFLGLWADRTDARYFVIVAPTVTSLCMSLLGVAPSYAALVVLVAIAGLSTAAFHPAAASSITRASGATWGRGSSLFMTGGELGRSIGPLFIVSLVAWIGLERTYVAAIPGIACSVVLYLRLQSAVRPKLAATTISSLWSTMKQQRRSLLLLSGLVLFRATSVQSFSIFYPTFLTSERGVSLIFAGMALSAYELAGAAGALTGGTLSDMVGRRGMLVLSQLVSGPLLFLTLLSPEGPTGLLLLAAAGFVAMLAGPVQLTLVQELLPGNRSTAAGLIFFLGFEGTLVSTLAVGLVADWLGLGTALSFSVLASMLSIPFTLALPEPKRARN